MSMIFQSYAVWPHMTVAQNVAYGLKFKNLSRADTEQKVRPSFCGVVHLAELKDRYPASSRAASSNAWRSPGRSW